MCVSVCTACLYFEGHFVCAAYVAMCVYCVFCVNVMCTVCVLCVLCRVMMRVFMGCLAVADCAVVKANGSPEIASIDGKLYIESEFELGRSGLSVVFGARPYGSSDDVSYDWVIKYSCTDMRNEFTAMRILNNTSISPKVYYLSPRVRVAVPGASFVPEDCVGKPLSYLVMDRVGQSVGRVFKRPDGPVSEVERKRTAVKLLKAGISVMSHLEQMHRGGLVHGDVHAGNIAYSCDDVHSDCETIVLIDFGDASNVGKGLRTPSTFIPYVLSPWQLLGRPRTHRDDVYRLVQVLANVAANFHLAHFMSEAIGTRSYFLSQTQVQKLIDWKVNAFGFRHCYILPSEICSFLTKHLVPIVTRLTETDMPDHRKIIDVLKQAFSLVQSPTVGTSNVPRSTVAGSFLQPAVTSNVASTVDGSSSSASRAQPAITGTVASTVHADSSSASQLQPAVTSNVASTVHASSSSASQLQPPVIESVASTVDGSSSSATQSQPVVTESVASTVHAKSRSANRLQPPVTRNAARASSSSLSQVQPAVTVASTEHGHIFGSRIDVSVHRNVASTLVDTPASYIPTTRGILVFPASDRITRNGVKRAKHTHEMNRCLVGACQNQILPNSAVVGFDSKRIIEEDFVPHKVSKHGL